MPVIGSIGPYEDSEDFETYVDRVELFFTANAVGDGLKVATFLSLLGPKVYGLLQNLVSPRKPKDLTYAQLVTQLKNHYKPKTIIVFERYKFYNRKQNNGESIADYVAGLKACAHTCDFGNSLNEMLRDRLVCGIQDVATQRALLTEADLTFSKAVEVATAREAAAKDVQVMGRQNVNENVMNISYRKNAPTNRANSNKPSSSSMSNTKPNKQCSGCGALHWRSNCPFKDAVCHKCKRKGHIQKVCFSKTNQSYPKSNSEKNIHSNVQKQGHDKRDNMDYDDFVFHSNNKTSKPIYICVSLDGKQANMELDTGAARSLMSYESYLNFWSDEDRPKLKRSAESLKVYGGSPITISGELSVLIRYKERKVRATMIVVKENGPLLMGRDLISELGVLTSRNNELKILNVDIYSLTMEMSSKFPNLFSPGLGHFTEYKCSLDVDPNAEAKFFRARSVPYAMKPKLDKALDSLQRDNIISPISYSRWAAPVVPVLKPNGEVRVCGDYKVTVNKAIKLDTYPIPKVDDLFSSLAGGKIFTKLDMSQAYCQLELDDKSKEYTVINTHRGLFQYNRLCFGVSSAPGIFQRTVEQLLRGIPGVLCYLDDILITGSTTEEHKTRLEKVLARLNDVGFKLSLNKCYFSVPSVSYLGYVIDASGLHPSTEKVKSIVEAPAPTNLKQLESYLGVFNFYRRFVPNASSVLEPLNALRRSGKEWTWKQEQIEAFQQSKKLLLNSSALAHFDANLPLSVTADSSPYGLGAVLNHIIDNQERPICFASRTLLPAERNYPQVEKEALAIVYALKQFHTYLWGQAKFRVITDHKPLLGLFNPNKPIPPMASGRIQRWSLMLQSYSFDLVHRSGVTLGTADALSRLPLPGTDESVPIPGEWINMVNFLDSSPVDASHIRDHTRKDPLLSKVVKYSEIGWPTTISPDNSVLMPYFKKRDELSLEAGCLLWGSRVVIPSQDRPAILKELHGGHVGASRMKELARSYLWWPNIDGDLENLVKTCNECLTTRNSPPKAELHPWEWPAYPWHRLHIDYAGPVQGKYFLVLVDAHSKWVEIFPTVGPSTAETIKHLRHCFCQFGFPVTVVSDNGPCFTSQEFKEFLECNGVRHVKSAVYKPSTNGLAERMVQTFKNGLKTTKENWSVVLDKFLFKYRLTPHSTTGVSPAELMFKRKLRCRLDLLHPSDTMAGRILKKQECQKTNHSSHPRHLRVSEDTPVLIRNYSTGNKFVPATINEQTGPVSFRCELEDGRIVKRHQDQIISGETNTPSSIVPPTPVAPMQPCIENGVASELEASPSPLDRAPSSFRSSNNSKSSLSKDSPTSSSPNVGSQPPAPNPTIRRSSRVSRPPKRLDL